MRSSYIAIFLLQFIAFTGAVPRRLTPECRSNACDDRPECPRTTCRCLFASRMDCAVYYQCVNGKPYQYRCSPGLLFNSDTLSCDYSSNVNCGSNSTVSTSTVDANTTLTGTTRADVITTELTEKAYTTVWTTTEKPNTTSLQTSTTKITEESFTTVITEKPTTTEISEPITTETTKEPTTTETTKEPATTELTKEPTTTETTKEPTTTETTKEPTTTELTKEPTTTETTKEPTTTEITKEPTTTETTKEPTTTETTKEPTTTEITKELTTTETTKEPTTTEITKELTTTETTKEPTTTVTTKEPTTTEATKEPTTTEVIKESTTTETTKEPTTIETTKEHTTAEITKEPITTKIASESPKTISVTTTEKSTATNEATSSITTITTTGVPVSNVTLISTEIDPVSTTVAPFLEFLCPSRFGLFPDPKSCNRFYHCSHWTPYHKWCPSNLHFNPKLRVCDWPYKAGCGSISPTSFEPNVIDTTPNPGTSNGTCACDCCELPVPGDCSAYVLCIDRVAFQMRCGQGLYFNPMSGTCDLPENVDCVADSGDQCPEKSGRYLLEGSCAYFTECQGGKQTVRKCPEGLQFNQSSEMCSWTGSCSGLKPGDSSRSKILADLTLCNGCSYCFKPHETDCARYIRCSQDVATEERCASGLFFNPDTELCDHDYNVQCPEPQSQPQCPQKFGYFPYPGECGLYLQCKNGSAVVKTCPGVLHFDPLKKHCDWPWAAGCNDSNSNPMPEPITNSTICDCECCLKPTGNDCRSFILCISQVGFIKSCSSGLRFNPQTENCDFAENVDCPKTPEIPGYHCPEYEGLFPHPNDCEKFIHCAHGFPYVKDCPSHLHFNPILKVCDWPYAAGCQDFPATKPPADGHDLPCDICDSCFIPDETDCASYTYCRNGTGHRLRCTESLLFNPEIEACDVSSNVKCTNKPSSQCLKPDGLFPAEECSQFIHCSNGIAYLKDCPDGLQFNSQLLVCDWPENVNCGETPVQPTVPSPGDDPGEMMNGTCNCDCCFLPYDNDCSKYILCLDGYMHVGQCSRGLLFNPIIQNCDFAERVTCGEASPLCPQPNGLFPIPKECSSYVKCSNGASQPENCPNGLHFSAEKRQCLDPCIANCDNSYCNSTTPGSSPSPSTTPSTTPFPYCPERDGIFPNKDDCASFYHCSNGRPYLVNCPPGLHFSSEYKVCEYPCDAKCNTSIDCNSSIPSSSPTSLMTPSTTPSPYCPEADGTFPNKEDCASFYQCSNGRPHLVNCPQGLHFSAEYNICEYPCEAKCNTSIDCSPSTTTPSPLCPTSDGIFPNEDDCASFYRCSKGKANQENCPSGLHFSYEHQVCEHPCHAKCNSSIDCSLSTTTPSPYCSEGDGLFPNTDDCTSFYKCSGGRAYLMNCPSDLHFSSVDHVCDYPCEAKCNTSIDCNSTTPSSSTTSSIPTTITSSPFCPEKDGIFSNKDDCGSFYMCSNGKSFLINCPPDLHFSPNHQVCEYPCNAKCNTSIDCTSTTSIPSSTPLITPSTTPSPNCPEKDGIFPNNDDCSSFYKCSGGRAYLMNCPSGLHFSSQDVACEYPCEAKCNKSIDCSPTTPKPITSTLAPHCLASDGLYPVLNDCSAFYLCSNGKEYLIHCPPGLHFSEVHETCETPCTALCNKSIDCGTTVTPESSTPNPISPECDEPDGLFPNLDDCGSFFQCTNGQSDLITCPSGLHFNIDDAACERPCVAGCDMSIDCPPEIPDTKGNCTCNSCFLSDPTDCSAFYYCDGGSLSKSYCNIGKLFSKVTNVCEDEDIVDCEANGDPSMCPEPYGFFPYPGDCKKFVHCDNGVAHVRECQSGLEYDPLSRVCTKPKGNCGNIVLDPNCPEPTGIFPDSTNCSLFYHCEHGVAHPKRCSAPLMFNPEKKVCDWPENVACGRDTIKSSTTVSTMPSSLNISTPGITPSVSPTTPSSECHEVQGVICPCACRVPTYDECSSYYQCQEDGTACKKFCPEGLYFNKREMVCDIPENLECRDFFFSTIRRAKFFSHHLRH